jgi:hypothetical protein
MGDLEVGDYICTPYNGIQKVSNIYEQGEHTIYGFHFDDGTTVSCMDNHRFWARTKPDEEFHEMTAREIMDIYKIDAPYPMSLRKGETDYVEFPLCGEVQLTEKRTISDLPLHPFLLGYISAQGTWQFDKEGIRLCNSSYDVVPLYKYGYAIGKDKKSGYYYLRGLSKENKKRITSSCIKQQARIPLEYQTASIEARWEYIRGIMYKYGKKTRTTPNISMPNKRLAEEIAQMARSLGMWAKVVQEEADINRMGWWKVVMNAPDNKEMFTMPNKKAFARTNAPIPASPHEQDCLTKKLICVKKSKLKQKCRCITVTGRDHLYMTDGYTINHNTVTMLMEPTYDIGNKHFNGIIFRKNKDDFENIINE